jgi:hypothetical protein
MHWIWRSNVVDDGFPFRNALLHQDFVLNAQQPQSHSPHHQKSWIQVGYVPNERYIHLYLCAIY